jgi:hypothetical protein
MLLQQHLLLLLLRSELRLLRQLLGLLRMRLSSRLWRSCGG